MSPPITLTRDHHDVQPWNAVNLGQLFLSRNEAQLTFTEGKVSLRIGGGEVYLEAKGYSGIDGQANKTPAAARAGDLVPPEEREGTWKFLFPLGTGSSCWVSDPGPAARGDHATSGGPLATWTA